MTFLRPAGTLAVFERDRASLRAAGLPASAVSAGDRLPDAPLRSATGEPTSLADVTGGRASVLVFYRGSWCPYCNLALKTYQNALLPILHERGIALVAISPQLLTAADDIARTAELEFPVLSDPGNVLSGAIGIVKPPTPAITEGKASLALAVGATNPDGADDVPFPTVLVVDADGTVVFADVHVDYTTRTEVDTIVASLARLGGGE